MEEMDAEFDKRLPCRFRRQLEIVLHDAFQHGHALADQRSRHDTGRPPSLLPRHVIGGQQSRNVVAIDIDDGTNAQAL